MDGTLTPLNPFGNTDTWIINLPGHDQDTIMKKRPNGENQHVAKERNELRRMIAQACPKHKILTKLKKSKLNTKVG